MFKFRLFELLLIFISIFLLNSSCTGDSEKRPSPLTQDSISIGETSLHIEYSSPSVRKRKIWGELVPYGEIWRTGANKASFLSTNHDIRLEDHLVPAGRYAIFTIPTDSVWTIIFNEDWDQWGAYNYDESKDLFRLKVYPQKSSFDERMKFTFESNAIRFDWEEITYELKIETTL